MLTSTSKPQSRTAYRSFRYSLLSRQSNIRTADPSSGAKFRIKRHSLLESTMNRTSGFQTVDISKTLQTNLDGHTTNYIRNFHSAMQSERKMSFAERQQWKVKPQKLRIQNFQQLDLSDFTILDPFQRHLTAIQTLCKNAQEETKKQSSEVKLIKGDLKILNKKITLNLAETQKIVTSHLQRFTSLLKQNTTKQQQTKLRFKQEIARLQIQHQQNIQKSNKILQQNLTLQKTIFNCEPYELTENQQWKEVSSLSKNSEVGDETRC